LLDLYWQAGIEEYGWSTRAAPSHITIYHSAARGFVALESRTAGLPRASLVPPSDSLVAKDERGDPDFTLPSHPKSFFMRRLRRDVPDFRCRCLLWHSSPWPVHKFTWTVGNPIRGDFRRKLLTQHFRRFILLACVGLAWAGGDEAAAFVCKNRSTPLAGSEARQIQRANVHEKGTYYGMGNGLP